MAAQMAPNLVESIEQKITSGLKFCSNNHAGTNLN
jgi:hypothetical protein